MPWKDNCCCDVPLSLLQAKNLSLFSHSLGSCYVDISLLLSFSFIFLYSQEMYSPFQVYSCNKRTPLAFFLCTLYLLTLIDFFIIIFFFISTKPDCKTRAGQGENELLFSFVGVANWIHPFLQAGKQTKWQYSREHTRQSYATRKSVNLLSLCEWLNGWLKKFSITHAIEGTE